MGSEVDNFLKHQMHQMQRNSLNLIFKILRHQGQMILSSNMCEKNTLTGFLEGFVEAIQVSSL